MRIRLLLIVFLTCSLGYARTGAGKAPGEKHLALPFHHKRYKHKRHRYGSAGRRNPNLYDAIVVEAGYCDVVFKDKRINGGTFNIGLQGSCDHITVSLTTGFDFATNPSYLKTDSLPSPDALHNYIFLDEALIIGVPLGSRAKIEIPLKTNLAIGKHTPPIPTFANAYPFNTFAPGANLMFRLNPSVSGFNVWLGAGADYRLAYSVKDIHPSIGRNEDYSGLSCFAFLRFDFR